MTELVAKLVAAVKLPVALTDLPRIVADLEAEHGPGLTVTQDAAHLLVSTPGRRCECRACEQERAQTLADLTDGLSPGWVTHMVVCEHCGDKRCPHAAHHDNACTSAPHPGQCGQLHA